jgi:hypothetical protein
VYEGKPLEDVVFVAKTEMVWEWQDVPVVEEDLEELGDKDPQSVESSNA